MRTLIISNASSGQSEQDTVESVGKEFEDLGEVTHLQPPSLQSFDEDVDRAAQDKDLVVVAGGDGTLNCALNALSGRLEDVVLAVVPMGTGNDFARTLDLPDDPREAARAIADGREASFDYGRATGVGAERLFLNACMGGFPVEVNKEIDERVKKRLGPLAFWIGGAKAAVKMPQFQVDVDGQRVEECIAVGIGNGRTAGGGIEVFPEADPTDGGLDCCVMRVSNVREGAELAAKVRSGEHVELEGVETLRGQRFEIRSEPDLEFNVDGDLLDLVTPLTFEVAGRLRMRVPHQPTK